MFSPDGMGGDNRHHQHPPGSAAAAAAAAEADAQLGFGDFDLFLPDAVQDVNGAFLEEPMIDDDHNNNNSNNNWTSLGTGGGGGGSLLKQEGGDWHGGRGHHNMNPIDVTLGGSSSAGGGGDGANSTTAGSTTVAGGEDDRGLDDHIDGAGGDGDGDDGGEGTGDKKAKRRRQIAAASRASRARRKRELEDLRDENKRLREERSQFLSKIGELQMKVETMRERGSTDMRVENELLRAQLQEHKRFVSCFKRLCDGAPTSLNARHIIYKQGSDSAQAHVLGLISQSQADGWMEARVPDAIDIPFQSFSMYYKYKADYGEKPNAVSGKCRQRLNVRVDVLFPGLDANLVSDFFWNSFSNTNMQQRLYGVKGIELTQLADDMPDKDTKMVYYREKWEAPKKDQDWVLICNRRRRDLAKSTLSRPSAVRGKPDVGKVAAMVLAMTTTQHSVAPEFDNAHRITSMFVQGAVTWNQGGDARLCVCFSFPDDFKIKAMEGFQDVIHADGAITQKFANVVCEFSQMLGEHNGFAMP